MELFGWKYEFKDDGNFYVIPPQKIERPATFCKYYGLKKHNVDALTSCKLYASHPDQLNDLADCNEELLIFDNPQVNRMLFGDINPYCHYLDDELLSEKCKEYARLAFYNMHFSRWGIVSFSSNPVDWMMWAHYAQKDGFCVEFDVEQFDFAKHGPFPINYQEQLFPIHLADCDTNLGEIALAYTNIKHKRWSYEEEWRLICYSESRRMDTFDGIKCTKSGCNTDRKFKYPLNAIKKVVLGPEFFKDAKYTSNKDRCTKYVQWGDMAFLSICKKKNLKSSLLDFLINKGIPIWICRPENMNELIIKKIIVKGASGRYYVTMTGETGYLS